VALAHGGPRIGPRWWLIGARPSSRSRPLRLTGGGATERGLHGESISGLTGAWVAAWRPSNDGGEVAVVTLGGGGAQARREERESGERCGEDRVGHHPFIGGAEGGGHRGFMAGVNALA
jgi:hypothetical protein